MLTGAMSLLPQTWYSLTLLQLMMGSTSSQIFVGCNSLVADVYGMKSEKQFVNTLEDNIQKGGAMEKLISDWAQLEISAKVHDILRALCIDDWQSEPHHQHQNFC